MILDVRKGGIFTNNVREQVRILHDDLQTFIIVLEGTSLRLSLLRQGHLRLALDQINSALALLGCAKIKLFSALRGRVELLTKAFELNAISLSVVPGTIQSLLVLTSVV